MSAIFAGFNIHIYVGVGGHGVLANVTRMVNRTRGVISVAITVSGLSGVNLSGMGRRLHGSNVSRRTVRGLRPVVSLSNSGSRGLRIVSGILRNSRVKLGNMRRAGFVLSALGSINLGGRVRLSLALTHNLGCCANTVFRIGTLSAPVNDVANNNHCSGLANVFNLPKLDKMNVDFNTSHVCSILGTLSLCPGRTIGSARILFVGFNRGRATCYLPVIATTHTTNVHARVFPSGTGVGGRVDCTGTGRVPFMILTNRGRVTTNGIALGGVRDNRRALISTRRLVTIIGGWWELCGSNVEFFCHVCLPFIHSLVCRFIGALREEQVFFDFETEGRSFSYYQRTSRVYYDLIPM